MYLVTGANYTHGRSLLQLLGSIRQWEPQTRVVVYDLGLTRKQRRAVLDSDLNGSVEAFPWNEYPGFFDINVNRGEYAWKPALIARELQKSDAPLCWMDAGNVVLLPLRDIREELAQHGFYSAPSRGTVLQWTHPLMFKALGLPPDFCADRRNLSGACIAFDPKHLRARALIEEWARLAEDKEMIAPPGSSRKNHRQDQALLTVLAYRSGIISEPSRKLDAFAIHRDLREFGLRRFRRMAALLWPG